MLGRASDVKVGNYIGRVLEPMATRLGVDYTMSILTPPRSEPAVALELYRCGLSLLMSFTHEDGWGVSDPVFGHTENRKQGRKAAKVLKKALVGDTGPDAISHMAQQYGRETAALWRRAIDSAENSEQAESLRHNAQRSEDLCELAGRYWPVRDRFEVLPRLAAADEHRFFSADNPNAMIDVRAAAARICAACEAAALALGPSFEDFASLLLGPVMTLNLELARGLAADWNFQLDAWGNLMREEPVAYDVILQNRSAPGA